MYSDLDFGTIAEKLKGMIHFKVEVMLIGVGAKANFFEYRLLYFRLNYFLLLLLLVFELGVIYHLAHWQFSARRNFY